MDSIISIKNLAKSYGDIEAVKDISFEVERGSLFAFLGVNGAGKSTTINILCTLLEKDRGEVIVNGHDLVREADAVRNDIGIVFQSGVMDGNLRVRENLAIRASFYGLYGDALNARLSALSDMLSLGDIMNRYYARLSGGQKRRVDIARALINEPKILFLDEPTTGLDPATRRNIWQVIENLRDHNNTTVFLTTHYMEEADNADDVVIIDRGSIIAHDTPANLKTTYSSTYLKIYVGESTRMDEALSGYRYVYENNYYKLSFSDTIAAREFLTEHSDIAIDFEVVKGNMDDVFLHATGRDLEEADYE